MKGSHPFSSPLARLLLFLLLLTFLSRAVDSFRIPRVVSQKPTYGKLAHKVTGSGVASASKLFAVTTLPGQTVKDIYVREGQAVEAGEVLFSVSTDLLAEEIRQIKQAQEILALEEADRETQAELEADLYERAKKRALEDYERTMEREDLQLALARHTISEAKRARSRSQDTAWEILRQIQETEQELAFLQTEWNKALAREEEAFWQTQESLSPEELFTSDFSEEREDLSDKDASEVSHLQGQIQEKEALLSSLAAQLDQVYAQADAEGAAVQAAEASYRQSVQAADDAVFAAARSVEDTQTPRALDSQEEIYVLSGEETRQQLEKLEALARQEGQIRADRAGTVKSFGVSVGEKTPDGACLLLQDAAAPLSFTFSASKNQQKYIEAGSSVTVGRYGAADKDKQKGCLVTSVEQDPQDPDQILVTVDLPAGSFPDGSFLQAELVRSSQQYPCLVPLSAVYEEAMQHYVYVEEEISGPLGIIYKAKKVFVTILEANETQAAIQSDGLSQEDRIITETDRPFTDGGRVRR